MTGIAARIGVRTLAIVGALGGSLALVAGLSVLDARLEAFELAAARPMVEPLPASQEGVERFAGATADRCVFAGPDRRLCRWQVDGRLVRSAAQGGAGDGTKVNLVCELPSNPSAPGSCRAHPVGETRLPAVSAAPSPGDSLTSFATVGALSHALGDIPARCTTGAASQACTWSLAPGDAGLGGFQADAEDSALRCLLPLDGSARAEGSCEVVSPD